MIEINEMEFEARSDCKYRHDYTRAVENIKTGKWEEKAAWRELILNDLWFIVYFVLKVKSANHQFIVDACREVEDGNKTKTLDLWARGHFKNLSCETPVLTTNGWKSHGELKAGDYIFGSDGNPTKVLATQHFSDGECYRVNFGRGVSIIAGKGHLWEVEKPSHKRIAGTFKRDVSCGKRNTRETVTVTTEELIPLVANGKYRTGITVAKPLQQPNKLLPVDPYVLGAWLGDGFSSNATICGIDNEIFNEIANRGYELHYRKIDPLRHKDYRVVGIKGLNKGLKELDLYHNKHIPSMYFTASEKQRRELLWGLIDTDGSVGTTRRNAYICFANSNLTLATHVQILAISLGYKARLTPSRTMNSWQVTFQAWGDDDNFPCFLSRKRALLKYGKKRHRASTTWYINSIEKVDSVDTNCIQVDNKDGMYLSGLQLIPTHNSTIITTAEVLQIILANPESRVGIFSHTRPASKSFLRRLKLTMEGSAMILACFPDVLYSNPATESPKWSLAADTPILTTKGWKRHIDLKVGDKVFGSNGNPITVIGNSGILKNADCRKVVFDDCELIASSEHLWAVQQRKSTNKRATWLKDPEIKILTTDELPIKDKSQRFPPTPSVQMSTETPYRLNPYILGLWLGDGTAGTNIISMASEDEEKVLAQIESLGFQHYIHRKKSDDNFSMHGVRGLKEILSTVGCLREKHIPDRYLFCSKQERLDLLQGLMDSDGTCKRFGSCAGMCMFSNTNKRLADGVFYLAASLGLRPSRCQFEPKQIGHKTIYQIYFVGIKSIPPFRLKRKLENCKEKRHKVGRYVRSVEKIGYVPVNCIKVDAPDGLYLAGESLVVTHNSEDDGLIVRRSGYYNEATLEAWGLVEGTPVGKHFTFRVYDDIETPDMVTTPEVISKLKNMFDISQNLSDKDARYRIVGTPYHYDGLIQHLRDQKNNDGTLKYALRLKPATVDGSANGTPVYLSQEELDDLKTSPNYNAQQLLDPTPLTDCKLRSDYLKDINPEFIPADVYKFMVIDPAGDSKDGKGDSWAVHVVGIEPKIDEIGASNIYITDSMISPMNDSEAIECIVRMYINGGMIMQLGVEKMGLSSVEVHVSNALRSRGRHISIDDNSLVLLRPAGRPKTTRIMQALHWPLNNGKMFISNKIPSAYRERLRTEMDRFPFWHDDGLDALSYFYDIIKSYRFGTTQNFTKKLKYNMAGIV